MACVRCMGRCGFSRRMGRGTMLGARWVGRLASLVALCLVAGAGEAQGTPKLEDVTASTGIRFEHLSSPEQRYIVESMSGGVALLDYDGDGWLDIYLTNAPNVTMALTGKKARGALYRNNHDGTFSDVTEKAGVATPCWAMGAAVADVTNSGRQDLLVSCFGGVVLYRNNGDGTFTDVTAKSGLAKAVGWATGVAFGDYDGDGVSGSVCAALCGSGFERPAEVRVGEDVPVSRGCGAVRAEGIEGVRRLAVPQQRGWDVYGGWGSGGG